MKSQNDQLASERDVKDKEIKKLESKNDKSLAEQLRHSQDQVRLLKSTMEQFLRMGVFHEESNTSSEASTT